MSKGALGQLSAYWPEETPRYAHVPLKTVSEILVHANARKAGERPALISAGRALSYEALSAGVLRVARGLRSRCERGARVLIAVTDPAELLIAAFGAFEAKRLVFLCPDYRGSGPASAFAPDLVVGPAELPGIPSVAFSEVVDSAIDDVAERPEPRAPILVLPKPDKSGEIFHNHRTLLATAVALGKFFMLAEVSQVVFLEPPTAWHTMAVLLATCQQGGTVWAAWDGATTSLPESADYVVCGWEGADRLLEGLRSKKPPVRIIAGVILGVEGPFSVSRRRSLSRKMKAPVLTLLGRNDTGPIIASHPSWFLDEAAGIPLPNVDTRPLNPAERTPLSIGWDVVEQAEIGVKSDLAPAGGRIAEGWLQTGIIAEVDPTGLYLLRPS
jgi:acyl-CoA synthetase (AMP-forming)/AMP-acid ligase II